MAEAFAKMHGKGKVEAFSAGSKPSGIVNPKAITAMKEVDYDLGAHQSKSVEAFKDAKFDYVIGMGCGDACPYVPARIREDWDIQDPKNLPPHEFNRIRDIIESEVIFLIENLE